MADFIRSHPKLCVGFLLLALTLAAYWRAPMNEFVDLDDGLYVYQNPHVQAGLTTGSVIWAFTAYHAGNWHPLTWLSHMVDWQIFGPKPWGPHLTNVLLHAINVLLLFLILSRMTGFLWRSAFVAALFAVHPLHVESVAWVAERKDVLSGLFWMLTTLAYIRCVERPGVSRYLLVVLLFALGLMAKPMLVTLPLVFLLLDYWPLARFSRKAKRGAATAWRLILEKSPLFALAAASCALTFLAQQSGGAVQSLETYSLAVRVGNALASYVRYLSMTVWPAGLAGFYPHPGDSLPVWHAFGAGFLILVVSILVLRACKSGYMTVGWLWYLGTLVPVIGVFQVGGQAMADRYTYIPSIGLFVIAAWGAPELLQRMKWRETRAMSFTAAAIILALAIATSYQVGYWRNTITLFQRALAKGQDSWIAHNNLGRALANQGHVAEAMDHYNAALRIAPNNIGTLNNVSIALVAQGDLSSAVSILRKAEAIDPGSADTHFNLGHVLAAQGDARAAVQQLIRAVNINPENAETHFELGRLLMKAGDKPEAAARFRRAISLQPSHIDAHYELGNVLGQLGRFDDAIAQYRRVLRLKPDSGFAHRKLAVAFYFSHRYENAWREARLAAHYGCKPQESFLAALSAAAPDPGSTSALPERRMRTDGGKARQ